ncbi:MAG: PE-PPE domain-containing protein, partial [Mycobacterium sp.]
MRRGVAREGVDMKVLARSLVVIFVVLIAVPALAVTYTLTTTVQLLATTALIMGGTEHPLSTPPDTIDFVEDYLAAAEDNYIDPDQNEDLNSVAVIYPAEFFPVFGSTTFDDSVQAGRENLNTCLRDPGNCDFNENAGIDDSDPPATGDTFKVLGYSQSAVVASLVKQDLIDNPPAQPINAEFFVIANPMRKNGGILARGFEGQTIPGLGITFHGGTPTNSPVVDPG